MEQIASLRTDAWISAPWSVFLQTAADPGSGRHMAAAAVAVRTESVSRISQFSDSGFHIAAYFCRSA